MRIHFFTAPFWLLSFGSGLKVQGSRGGFAAFFRRWYSRIVSLPRWGRLSGGNSSDTGETHFQHTGGSQPRLAAPGSPFQRKGRECGAF